MKTHDTLGRRRPRVRTPELARIGKSKDNNDVETFHFMHRHGGILPMSYILAGGPRSCRSGVQARFRNFADAGIIDQPNTPFRTSNSMGNEQLHWLNKLSLSYLEGQDLYRENAIKLQPPLEHHMMIACTTASFEIEAKKRGLWYMPQQDLTPKQIEIPTSGKTLKPDAMFLINGLIVFLEADRSTEPNTSTKYRQSLEEKILRYKEVIDNPFKYKEHFNVKEPALLLFVTTTEAKRRAFLALIEKHYPKGNARALTHVLPMFGADFQLPKPMDLLSVEYQRSGYGVFKFA